MATATGAHHFDRQRRSRPDCSKPFCPALITPVNARLPRRLGHRTHRIVSTRPRIHAALSRSSWRPALASVGRRDGDRKRARLILLTAFRGRAAWWLGALLAITTSPASSAKWAPFSAGTASTSGLSLGVQALARQSSMWTSLSRRIGQGVVERPVGPVKATGSSSVTVCSTRPGRRSRSWYR
jgi:hypothetical protein